ncbi:PRA1 family protein [Entamoeba marina]
MGGFDFVNFMETLMNRLTNEIKEMIGKVYDLPKDFDTVLNRLKVNTLQQPYCFTLIALVLCSLISFMETWNFLPIFMFVVILLAYLVVDEIDSSLLDRAMIKPEYVHIIASLVYLLFAFICDILTFSFFSLVIPVIGVIAISILQKAE